ncbi:MAG: endonuclease III [Candidatus Krumholzibacteria bacterium]|nr:endonuclease III [Candidatus Krumholzibacteria bacterium]
MDAGKIDTKKARAAGKADARRALAVLAAFKRLYPDPRHYLKFESPFQLLVATILSAQCTDEKVNEVTSGLFKEYPRPEDLAGEAVEAIERAVRPTGFYRNKAKAIKGASAAIVERFGGSVPDTMDELLTLPGIARKSANAILQHGFGKVEGVVVDTHVIRVAGRLGWTANTDPGKIEQDLMRLFERNEWLRLPFYLKSHGRAVCKAPVPKCGDCAVAALCPSALIGPPKAPR